MRKLGYGLVVLLTSIWYIVGASAVMALPSSDVVVNYTDYPQVSGTLKALDTVTANNTYNGSAREHDRTVSDQTQAGPSQLNSYVEGIVTYYETSGPHGKFTDNTEACGRCHALHTAKSSRLIRFDTMPVGGTANNPIYGTCTYCHNFNGQSTYDVKDGMIWDRTDGKRYATSGGGFERMLVVEGEAQVATVVKASSSHMVNKNSGTKYRAPGGYMGGVTTNHIELTCSTCHNPHGSNNSRLLREKVVVPNVAGAASTRQTWQDDFVRLKVNNPFGDERVQFSSEITYFCSRCHNDYKSSSATSTTGTYSSQYRHKIGMAPNEGINNGSGTGFGYNATKFNLPTADLSGGSTIECLTCHYAHGTFIRVNNIKTYDNTYVSSGNNSIDLQNLPGYTGKESPKNLRMDNRGVCQNCHNWSSVDTTSLSLADVLDPAQNGSVLYGDNGSVLNTTKVISPTLRTIVIRFAQYVLVNGVNSAEAIGNYSLDNTTDTLPVSLVGAIAKVQPDGRSVVIRLPNDLTTGKNYRLTIQNIKDTNFTSMNITTADFSK